MIHSQLSRFIALPLALGALLLAGCGGGGSSGSSSTSTSTSTSSSTPDNWARLRDFTLTPSATTTPAYNETVQVRLDYYVDFESNTHLPTFDLTGHILPKGATLLSAATIVNRVLTQPCGQLGNACGEPFERLCSYTVGWLNMANRRIVCDGMNPAIEVPPGEYQFVANVCYTDGTGTRVCSSKSVPITFN